ncbi:MAG: hypothetical protein DLM58_12890 [Pseudonocardiales bacterium]|nr:MAG: hypothetical protein DLM58_12890 [Pseudonocardiales bacterium]
MPNTHTLSSDLTVLTHALQRRGTDLETQIRGLADSTRRAVDSYLGMRLTLIIEGHSITVTAMNGSVAPGDILASARLPLAALSGAEPGSVIALAMCTPLLRRTPERSPGAVGARYVAGCLTRRPPR